MSLKIVYLDDELDLCELFLETHSSEKVSIKIFTDPEMALKAINEEEPDLIFLDHRLPNKTGAEVASQVSQVIPKVLITGDDSIKTCKNFVKIFYKPYDFVEIEEFINSFADQKNSSPKPI